MTKTYSILSLGQLRKLVEVAEANSKLLYGSVEVQQTVVIRGELHPEFTSQRGEVQVQLVAAEGGVRAVHI